MAISLRSWTDILSFVYQRLVPPTAIVCLVSWGILRYWFKLNPPIGTYIVIVAVGAIVVTIWPPGGPWGKAAWLGVFVSLGVFEVHNLYRDRNENQENQKIERKAELDSFDRIAKAFESTRQGIEENSNKVTGGSDFPEVYSVPLPTLDGGISIRVIAMHCYGTSKQCTQGNYPLRSVRLEYIEGRPPYLDPKLFSQIIAGTRPFLMVGDLQPHVLQPVGMTIHPSIAKGAFYTFNVYALNGSVSEAMEFRYSKTKKQWESGIRVTRSNDVILEDWLK